MKVSAVLFDAAGTLIELAEPLGETYARVARDFGVDLPAWRLEEAFGRMHRGAPPMTFPDARAEEVPERERGWWRALVRATLRATDGTARFEDFDGFFQRLFDTYASPAAWRPARDSGEALAALRARGLATAVVSNFDHRLPGILAGLGLAKDLDAVVLPGEARALKPASRIFELALEQLSCPAAAAVFVGDDARRDLEGAQAAGLRAIDVAGLATLLELPARIERLAQEPA